MRASSEQELLPALAFRVLSCEMDLVGWMWLSGGKDSALAVADSLGSRDVRLCVGMSSSSVLFTLSNYMCSI